MTDEEIVTLYWQRKQEAIAVTEEIYGRRLQNLANNILHSEQDGEECVSDTYLKAWNSMPPQRPRNLLAYLAKICRFVCFDRLDWQKAEKRKASVVELSAELSECIADETTERNMTGQEIGRLLDAFIKGLSAEKRQLFLRRYWLAQPVTEIAKAMNCSQSKVKTELYRIRKRLKSYLKEEGISI